MIDSIQQGIALIIVAAITALGTMVASRLSSRNERQRISQELVTIVGTEREKLADELDALRKFAREMAQDRDARAHERDEYADKLRQVKDEFAAATIAHREAVAELNAAIRERMAEAREFQSQLASTQALHEATESQLRECRDELERSRRQRSEALELINRQARLLANSPDRGVILQTDPELIRPTHNTD